MRYNEKHGITPESVKKKVGEIIEIGKKEAQQSRLPTRSKDKAKRTASIPSPTIYDGMTRQEKIEALTKEMKAAAKQLEFERAAYLRDCIADLSKEN